MRYQGATRLKTSRHDIISVGMIPTRKLRQLACTQVWIKVDFVARRNSRISNPQTSLGFDEFTSREAGFEIHQLFHIMMVRQDLSE